MLTIRSVTSRVMQSLKALGRRHRRPLEEVREPIVGHVERRVLLDGIEAGWARQSRRPAATEVDAWIESGRS